MMNQFTNLTDAKSIEELYQKLVKENVQNKEKLEELKEVLENQTWKAWEDKTVDANIAYVYDRLKNDLEKKLRLVHWAERFRARGNESGAKDIERKIVDFS